MGMDLKKVQTLCLKTLNLLKRSDTIKSRKAISSVVRSQATWVQSLGSIAFWLYALGQVTQPHVAPLSHPSRGTEKIEAWTAKYLQQHFALSNTSINVSQHSMYQRVDYNSCVGSHSFWCPQLPLMAPETFFVSVRTQRNSM